MALRAALALADVCTTNYLVIIFYFIAQALVVPRRCGRSNLTKMVTHGIDGVDVHVKNKFHNEKVKLAKLELVGLDPFPRHDFTTAFRDETNDDLIGLGCSKYDHMLIPGGLGLAKGVTLSIIDSETWSGKPEPGTDFHISCCAHYDKL